MSEISKTERFLTMRVDYFFVRNCRRMFGWLWYPIKRCVGWYITAQNFLYYDYDTWGMDEDAEMADSQLYKLGLNVEAINDEAEYWEYDHRVNRRRNGKAPEWGT